MCTIVAALGHYTSYPVVIAANRDEALDRPSSGPRLWPGLGIPFVAPVDEKAGGSWLGLNARGVFVGITNRFMAPRDPARRSRGQVVLEALNAESAESLHRRLFELDPRAFNAFHLFYADPGGFAGVTWTDGEALRQERLGPGVHVITERSYGAADVPRAEHIRHEWSQHAVRASEPGSGAHPDVEGMQRIMSRHTEDDPLAATCIHVPAFNYGTRSSSIWLLSEPLRASKLWWAEGPPGETAYVGRHGLIAELS